MAHDKPSHEASFFADVRSSAEDKRLNSVQCRDISRSSKPFTKSVYKPKSPEALGRIKAMSVTAAPMALSITRPSTEGSSEALRLSPDTYRRSQSDGNLRTEVSTIESHQSSKKTAPLTCLVSPAHSESALINHNGAIGLPSVFMRPMASSKSTGLMALGGTLLAEMADFAGMKSPGGTAQQVHVVYSTPGPLFVDLYSRDDGTGARVKGFRRKPDGSMGDSEASKQVYPGDELMSINAIDVTKMVFADIITTTKEATFPLTLTYQCLLMNRLDYDKSAPPKPTKSHLLTMSPLNSAKWGSRLYTITRSESFDQKSQSPTAQLTTLEPNGEKFGFSLTKVGADGVKKNLFRMIGNKISRPEEDGNIVRGWINDLVLKPQINIAGGRHRRTFDNESIDVLHSTPIVAVTTGGRFVGVLDVDRTEFALTWFRQTPPDVAIRPIQGVTRCPYFPSVDDVGSILSLQCQSLRFPQLKRVVEMPKPFVLDPAVKNTVDVLLEAKAGSFSATLASNEHDSFQITISSDAVSLIKVSEDIEEGGVVVKVSYSPFVQVLLDPADPLRFALKVQEFGGLLGTRKGDVCDPKMQQTQLQSLSCFFLVAQNRQNRDILTLLIRKFRARVITLEEEAAAQIDEQNLYMDPAYVVSTAFSSSLTASLYSGENSDKSTSPARSFAVVDTDASFKSPTSTVASVSGSIISPVVETGKQRLESEGSFSSISNVSLSDLVGLEFDYRTNERSPDKALSDNRIEEISKSIAGDTIFLEGRLAAQDEELAMLRTKLSLKAVLLKAAEQEHQQLAASIEVKDNRIEHQQLKLRQLEKALRQSARETKSLRTTLEDKERQLLQYREELQRVCGNAGEMRDKEAQTETQLLAIEGNSDAGGQFHLGKWNDAMNGCDLRQQFKEQQIFIRELEEKQVKLVTERNMFRAKSMNLSKELQKLVKANNNESLDDLKTQLAERHFLKNEVVRVKAKAEKTADKVTHLSSLLKNRDKDRGTKRLAAQVVELERTVHQLQDSLTEARDQVDAVKQINTALASRLATLQSETRGSIDDTSDDEDEGDDEEEDEVLENGIAAFRRSLVGSSRLSV
ncbi:hypothetical protein CCR75_001454 [Bremia lactucae]|uniref:PDZ domain-containing protein n=1 Tax=Bremia lactucae TaxID=4779 RepID=A0A976IM05_BRELC|nr:hypothetical protein CCR75_001454 [Bremia lactucae]